jgi:hypothetical protein
MDNDEVSSILLNPKRQRWIEIFSRVPHRLLRLAFRRMRTSGVYSRTVLKLLMQAPEGCLCRVAFRPAKLVCLSQSECRPSSGDLEEIIPRLT